MAKKVATKDVVEQGELLDFVRTRHQWVMATTRADGRPQMSPVTGGVNGDGKMVVATYPSRDKVHNIRRDGRVTICVLSDHFGGAWVQVDGLATVVDLPEAEDGLVDYFRSISGEHSDWEEYREAMRRQGKCLIEVNVERWGPIATGGFPAAVVPLLDEVEAADKPDDVDDGDNGGEFAITGFASGADVDSTASDSAPNDDASDETSDDDKPTGFDIAGFGD